MTQPAPTKSENSRNVPEWVLSAFTRFTSDETSPATPSHYAISESIWSVFCALKDLGYGGERISPLIRSRVEAGMKTYGTPLMTHNGRDALRDAIEELADALLYLYQADIELYPDADACAVISAALAELPETATVEERIECARLASKSVGLRFVAPGESVAGSPDLTRFNEHQTVPADPRWRAMQSNRRFRRGKGGGR